MAEFHWQGPLPAPDFVMIPKLVHRHILKHLSGGEFKVFYCLMVKAYEWGHADAELSLSEITDQVGISRSTAILAIKTLTEKGLLATMAHENPLGDRDPNTYRLLVTDDPRYIDRGSAKIDPPSTENRSGWIENRSSMRARSNGSKKLPKEEIAIDPKKYSTGRYAVCETCHSRPCVCE